LTLVVVLGECFLGGWLLLGVFPRLAKRTAVATFLCFLFVSLARLVRGESSCACFGKLDIAPLVTVIIDLAVLFGLAVWKPDRESSPAFPLRRLHVWAAAGLLLAIGIPLTLRVVEATAPPPLIPDMAVVDLGTVAPGGRKAVSVRLINGGGETIQVVHVDSSCPCLTGSVEPDMVGTGEALDARVSLDLDAEPEFVGPLRVHLVGRSPAGVVAFSLQVKALVEEAPSAP
jgi:hypothetical protein